MTMRFRQFLDEDGYGNFGDDVRAGVDAAKGVVAKIAGAVSAANAKDEAEADKAEREKARADRQAAKQAERDARAKAKDDANVARGEAGSLIAGGEQLAANLANGPDEVTEKDVVGLDALPAAALQRLRSKVETVQTRVLRELPAAIRRELAQADFLDADQRNSQRISQLMGEPSPEILKRWRDTYKTKPKLAQPWDKWLASRDVGASAKGIVEWLKSIDDAAQRAALAGAGSGKPVAPMNREALLKAVSSKLSLASERLAELLTVLDVAADKASVAAPPEREAPAGRPDEEDEED